VVGWRERDGMHGAVFRVAETTAFLPLATVRASHKATVRSRQRDRPVYGGEHGEHGVGTKKAPKAGPCLQGYGARMLGCTLASAVARTGVCARTRTRRGRDAGAPTRRDGDRMVAASYGKREEARRVARTSTKAAAPAEDCNPAWLDGRHHQKRRGGAVARIVPPRLEGRGVHRGGEAASSPGWPLAEV
jgi:hypothetical protein